MLPPRISSFMNGPLNVQQSGDPACVNSPNDKSHLISKWINRQLKSRLQPALYIDLCRPEVDQYSDITPSSGPIPKNEFPSPFFQWEQTHIYIIIGINFKTPLAVLTQHQLLAIRQVSIIHDGNHYWFIQSCFIFDSGKRQLISAVWCSWVVAGNPVCWRNAFTQPEPTTEDARLDWWSGTNAAGGQAELIRIMINSWPVVPPLIIFFTDAEDK